MKEDINSLNGKLSFFENLLYKMGYKSTGQRTEILKEFLLSDTHLSVEQLYEKLRPKDMGLATIYRNIKLFTDVGILKEINIDGNNYYEIICPDEDLLHIHFKCKNCGYIMDIDEDPLIHLITQLNKIIENDYDVQLSSTEIVYYGLCKNCKKNI
ncbi:MAG: transcriptional repressor [Xylanivirga thermophila]|jgi:Fur family transcriptional regulator, ferric uptake regulator|uniref:Fur family transcriptional regulator n=1 Tax=Xylanivirga thermophila TaxID=2496273 RepID=UPI00101D7047|nr:transcriptional repressor [Xylanivirga thermophila]